VAACGVPDDGPGEVIFPLAGPEPGSATGVGVVAWEQAASDNTVTMSRATFFFTIRSLPDRRCRTPPGDVDLSHATVEVRCHVPDAWPTRAALDRARTHALQVVRVIGVPVTPLGGTR
jgi:hypothetical protein